ncbi:hypothetical protein NKL05_34195 [Mesorhizobium sp. C420B]
MGTPLTRILKEAGVLGSGIQVAFWGTDDGEITRHHSAQSGVPDRLPGCL